MVSVIANGMNAMKDLQKSFKQAKSIANSAKAKEIMNGEKALLSFTKLKLEDGKLSEDTSPDATYEVPINPAKFSKKMGISYKQENALGKTGKESEYREYEGESVDLSFVLDSTGSIVQDPDFDVFDAIKDIKAILYDYDGKKHEPNRVAIIWGNESFYGRLKSMHYEHVLFHPNGKPLRATVSMSFVECKSSSEIENRNNTNSPDLSHLIEVVAGDSLPLMCFRIYKDARYCHAVARVNALAHVSDIKPGMRLWFPPLEK